MSLYKFQQVLHEKLIKLHHKICDENGIFIITKNGHYLYENDCSGDVIDYWESIAHDPNTTHIVFVCPSTDATSFFIDYILKYMPNKIIKEIVECNNIDDLLNFIAKYKDILLETCDFGETEKDYMYKSYDISYRDTYEEINNTITKLSQIAYLLEKYHSDGEGGYVENNDENNDENDI